MSGTYDADGRHRCDCGEPTRYQSMSGGREYYCEACDMQGPYPDGDGGPRARLLTQPDGFEKLRRMMYEEIGRRRGHDGALEALVLALPASLPL